jgi:formylglycine-generating enzyme required for sulfatase activity
MGKFEVTQEEWASVMKDTALAAPSTFRTGGVNEEKLGGIADTSRFPVENVSWDDCQQFLAKANANGGILKEFNKPGVFVLPHQDQWEYACRGGKGGAPGNRLAFYWGLEANGKFLNCEGTKTFGTTEVGPFLNRTCDVQDNNNGAYPAHPWGLHHMHGNVLEWCETEYEQVTGFRVRRGGSWRHLPIGCRSSSRLGVEQTTRDNNLGLRICIQFN